MSPAALLTQRLRSSLGASSLGELRSVASDDAAVYALRSELFEFEQVRSHERRELFTPGGRLLLFALAVFLRHAGIAAAVLAHQGDPGSRFLCRESRSASARSPA